MRINEVTNYLFCTRAYGSNSTFEMAGHEILEASYDGFNADKMRVLLRYLLDGLILAIRTDSIIITKNSETMESIKCLKKPNA